MCIVFLSVGINRGRKAKILVYTDDDFLKSAKKRSPTGESYVSFITFAQAN